MNANWSGLITKDDPASTLIKRLLNDIVDKLGKQNTRAAK